MKKTTKQKLIYMRYILPPVLMLAVLLVMLIPAYRFVVDGEINDTMSGLRLFSNAYEQARQVLFGGGEQQKADLAFGRTMLTLSIALPALYLAAFAVALYSAIVAMRYFNSDDEEKAEKSRTLFITFFPNRICLCLAEALMLPMIAFPYLMPYIYKTIYNANVTLLLRAPDGLILGSVAFVAIAVLTVICAPMERDFDADVFKKYKAEDKSETDTAEETSDYTPIFKSRDEAVETEARNQRIRELLGKNKEDQRK